MSLATRCPACGTVFRVVQDQLKVSEGWVRCGRCSEVFNAVDGLFDIEREGPPPIMESVPSAQQAPLATAASTGDTLPTPDHALVQFTVPQAVVHAAPVDPATQMQAHEAFSSQALQAADEAGADASQPTQLVPSAGADTPDFIRRANRAARSQQPALRLGMTLLALLLAALLAAQLALQYRDGLAANWPPARPWLERACSVLDCHIDAPRRIESLSVNSSGLLRIDNGPLYDLSLVLQNKGTTELMMPAIDLALTDSQGQTMARRVLYASELGRAAATLPALGEAALQGTLNLGERRVAGYTVELFYP